MDDGQIIQQIRDGKPAAFEALVNRYQSMVLRTVSGMLGRDSEIQDVAQETFIRFFKNISFFRGEATVATYLTRIAINLAINETRRRKRWRDFFVRVEPERLENIPAGASGETGDETDWIYRAIGQLPPKFRAVIVLRLIDGYTTEQTADILQIPPGTVLSRLTRGQKKLKIMLTPLLEKDNG